MYNCRMSVNIYFITFVTQLVDVYGIKVQHKKRLSFTIPCYALVWHPWYKRSSSNSPLLCHHYVTQHSVLSFFIRYRSMNTRVWFWWNSRCPTAPYRESSKSSSTKLACVIIAGLPSFPFAICGFLATCKWHPMDCAWCALMITCATFN